MKTHWRTRISRFVFALALLGCGITAYAQTSDFDISWFKVAGGGGDATDGHVHVGATIGQHDAGRLGSDGLAIDGGFWSVTLALNRPPTLTVPEDQTIDVLAALNLTASATDLDLPAQTLTFGLDAKPAGASISATSGLITWQPTAAQVGIAHKFIVRVTDNGVPSLNAVKSFTILVSNHLPTISSIANVVVPISAASPALPFTVEDVETPAASLVLVGRSSDLLLLPDSGIRFGGSGASRTVILQPAPDRIGDAEVTVTVADAHGGAASTKFQVEVTSRQMEVMNASGAPGADVRVPIRLVTVGNEHAMNFSLVFSPAILSEPRVALGSSTSGGSLSVDASGAADGVLGVSIVLPTGQTLQAGAREVATVTFLIASVTTTASVNIHFGDSPIQRVLADGAENSLAAVFKSGTVSIFRGFESDVTPRPEGKQDGTVRVTDWVQVGRFAIGLDTASSQSEFMRADCSPRTQSGVLVLGNGQIDTLDFVQAGRYAAALDPVTKVGGPAGQLLAPQSLSSGTRSALAKMGLTTRPAEHVVRAKDTSIVPGQTTYLKVELTAKGDENAVGFSLSFDPSSVRFAALRPGRDAKEAMLLANTNTAAVGRIGVILALPAGRSFTEGNRELVEVGFSALPEAGGTTTQLSFSNQPTVQQIASAAAEELAATFVPGTITISPTTDPALKFTWISRSPGGDLRLRLTGARPGQYVLEAATDLGAWSSVRTLTLTGSTLDFVEPVDANAPLRFYRVRLEPSP